jgi:hypothetical protein
MAYASPPAAPRTRPATVTAACYLLYLYAALQVLGVLVLLSIFSDYRKAFEDAYRGTSVENQADTIATVGLVSTVAVALIFGTGLVVLAIIDGKGRNVARIITWVVGGLALCCAGFGLIGNAAGSSMNFGNNRGGPSATDISTAFKQDLPSWFTPVTTASAALELIALLLAVVLLALPASNQFFRKQPPAQVWEPPLPPVPPPTAGP